MTRSATRIIAHRGDSGVAPENTLAAFRAAIAAGAEGVEFDVQASADGVPVVIHDERLERTTSGQGWVRDASAAQLAALDAGSWFDPPLAGEGVPTLEQVLDLLAPTTLEVHLELKTSRVPYPGLVPAVVRAVERAGLGARVVLSSFHHASLREARALEPRLPCAVLTSEALLEPWDYVRRHGFQGLHPHHRTVDAELVRGMAQAGLALRPYTVDDPAIARRLLELGVDGIITNQPVRLLRLRAGEAP